jgi:hypothetical protein
MKKDKIKEKGDQELVALVEKIQDQIAWQQSLNQTTVDMSADNVVASKILRAKYSFLYDEARHRHTIFSGITNAITK